MSEQCHGLKSFYRIRARNAERSLSKASALIPPKAVLQTREFSDALELMMEMESWAPSYRVELTALVREILALGRHFRTFQSITAENISDFRMKLARIPSLL